MTSFESDYLRPLEIMDAPKIRRLVNSTDDLSNDFPTVGNRYGSLAQAFLSARGVIKSSEIEPYAVLMDDEVCGLATVADFGAIEIIGTDYVVDGHNIAGWLGKDARQQGVARRAGETLVSIATEKDCPDKLTWTAIREANVASRGLAQYLGFVPVGEAGDYNGQIGDHVSAPRRLYILKEEPVRNT